jgi:tetratricopeptide (TPR) repeat protein
MHMTRFIFALTLLPGVALAGCGTPVGQGGSAMLADSGPTVIAQAGTRPSEPGNVSPGKVDAGTPATSLTASAPVDVDAMYKVLVAEFAGRRGQLGLALSNYLDVARRTGNPALAERAVRIAVYARDQEQGLEAARLWAATAEPNHEARQVYGALLVRGGRLEEAKEVLGRLVAELVATDPDVFTRMANIMAREKSRTASVTVMEALVADYPDNATAQFAFAQLLARFGEFIKALSALEAARRVDPGSESAAVFHAQVLQRQNKKPSAIEVLAGFLEGYPDSNNARLAYARLLVDAKRYAEARTEFQTLAEAAPENTDITYALGLLLLQTNDLKESEVQFRKLTDVPDRRHTAWFYIGQIAENSEDIPGALEAYRHVDRGEHHVNAQIRTAALMAGEGQVAEARQHLHALRGRNRTESVRIYRAEAEILARRELLEDAMGVYDNALVEFAKDSGLLYARAMLAVRLDRIDRVEADLRDVLSREPDNADALNALGYTLADRTERYQEAHDLIKRAYELKPDNHYIVDSLGWVLYRLGRLDEAIKHLRRAMELNPDPEVAAHLGEVLWVAGDKEGAKEVWNTALKEQPEDKRLLEVIKRFGL